MATSLCALLTLACMVALVPLVASAGSAHELPSRQVTLAPVAEPIVKVRDAVPPTPAGDPLRSGASKRSDLAAEASTAEAPPTARPADRFSVPGAGPAGATVEAAPASPSPASSSSVAVAQAAPPVDEAAQASAILARWVSQYPILRGTTVTLGETPDGHQAVSYYQSGRIIIASDHTVSLERILAHEIWHVIDWRDNGAIDWGEDVPPV